MTRRCKDCLSSGVTTRRPAPHPGPRCATHHKALRSVLSTNKHAGHIARTYGITAQEYADLLAFQDGRCYRCHRKPWRKRLAVDHDHALAKLHDHPEDQGCKKCIRGLLCSRCNKDLGWIRDDPAAMDRGGDYLRNPPARRLWNDLQVH